jgi:preprotein translocase subunit SecA
VSSASASLRPGATHGFYPERLEEREGLGQRAARALRARLARRSACAPGALLRFAREVRSEQDSLRGAGQERFAEALAGLRAALAREGPSGPLLVRAFALVREAAARALGVEHYDVQLMAGRVLAEGMLAEMETGEGKTLAATLPACAAALAGIPVHVITANDYLVERDADSMRPLYAALGLRVGAVVDRERDPERRRSAYRCDVTYATSKGIAFDYLRDGLERRQRRGALPLHIEDLGGAAPLAGRLLLRGLCFAIVDEADSVLIDEACTPLILSGSVAPSETQQRSHRRAVRLARALEPGSDFVLDMRERRVEITAAGHARLEELARPLGGFWTGPRRREEWVSRALSALHLYLRDRDYVVRDERVEIVDPPTGRAAPDRAFEQGLHQMIEVKEGCPASPERETLARISYQRFFRRYLRLAGTTGTAREVAREIESVYGLRTARIPTRLPSRRRSQGERVFATEAAKWAAVVDRVRELHEAGRPVLVGTSSVAASERLGELIEAAGLPRRVLNARQDAEEAAIVAEAGGPGRVTVATHMAGRGTDIHLGPGVAERGGLHVLATQRAPARRIDRQLSGRCGRQGEPGSFELLTSLEDEPVRAALPAWLRRAAASGMGRHPLASHVARLLISLVQRAEERRSARVRRGVAALDELRDAQLAFSGRGE